MRNEISLCNIIMHLTWIYSVSPLSLPGHSVLSQKDITNHLVMWHHPPTWRLTVSASPMQVLYKHMCWDIAYKLFWFSWSEGEQRICMFLTVPRSLGFSGLVSTDLIQTCYSEDKKTDLNWKNCVTFMPTSQFSGSTDS